MKRSQKEIVLAAASYLWIIGFIIAFFINKEEKSSFVTNHIKNMFGLIILALIAVVTNAYIHVIIGELLYLTSIGIWLFSIVTAFMGKEVTIPFLTKKYESWFTFLD